MAKTTSLRGTYSKSTLTLRDAALAKAIRAAFARRKIGYLSSPAMLRMIVGEWLDTQPKS